MAKRGETKEKILNAATEVFFENGFEASSVKMIIEKAGVVTGSFYHFFPSKELLFEAVVEKYLENYSFRICKILNDETLSIYETVEQFIVELTYASTMYYGVLQGNKLHWSLQYALHDKTIEKFVMPMASMIGRFENRGYIKKIIDLDDITLAVMLIRGFEVVIHNEVNSALLPEQIIEVKKKIFDFIDKFLVIL